MKCMHTKADGIRCNAQALHGKQLCFYHDPKTKVAVMQAARKGGLARSLQGIYGDPITIQTPADVTKLLSQVINKVWIGEIPVPVGTSMGFLGKCFIDAYRVSNPKINNTKDNDQLRGLSDDELKAIMYSN